MFEVVFLGTGSGIPSRRRNHAAIWIRHEGDCMLWDCGEGTQRQLLQAGLNFMKIDRIFITHWHADHWAGLISLIQTMNLEKRRKPLCIYAPEAGRFVGDLLDMDYWGPRFRIVPVDVPSEGKEITKLWETENFVVSSTPVKHTVPAVAYSVREKDRWNVDLEKGKKFGLKQGPLVGKLKEQGKVTLKGVEIKLHDVGILKRGAKVAYSGDTKPCATLLALAKDADLLIHDATFAEEDESKMHTGATDAAEVAKQASVKLLALTHFSRRYLDMKPIEKEAKAVFPNTKIAEDFLKLEVRAE
ncbi:MAG: ribonuclease Z [Candidatus Aenigmarchaeota archaeon]|nr:ribonuclease Z [Candidatus Aenigmarchaeota archaeon]